MKHWNWWSFEKESEVLAVLTVVIPLLGFTIAIIVPALLRWLGIGVTP